VYRIKYLHTYRSKLHDITSYHTTYKQSMKYEQL